MQMQESQEPHTLVRGKFGERVLCIKDLLFKTKSCRKSPKCQLKFNGNEIKVDDERYECKSIKNTFEFSISQFESKHVGEYECVVSTAEPIVSTAVKVVVHHGMYASLIQ